MHLPGIQKNYLDEFWATALRFIITQYVGDLEFRNKLTLYPRCGQELPA